MQHAPSELAPHRGVLVLVLGILALVSCQPLGVLVWILANDDLGAMRRGTMDPSGRDLTLVGKVCGIVAVALFVLVVVPLLMFAAWVMAASFGG